MQYPFDFARRCAAGAILFAITITAAATDGPAPANPAGAQQGVNVGGGERGIEAYIVEGPPITGNDVMSPDHAKFARGMVCVECHKVSYPVDAVASATRQIAGSSPQLTQEQIWAKIEVFLPGRERFALATADGNQPLATTVDMVLDKEERVLYVVSEVGTEKLNQIRRNPKVSAVRFQGWTVAERGKQEWRSTQLIGSAEVIPSSDPRFMVAVKKYQLVRLTPERAVRRFDLIRITPDRIWYFDTELSADGDKAVYQLWKRGAKGTISPIAN